MGRFSLIEGGSDMITISIGLLVMLMIASFIVGAIVGENSERR